MATLEWSIPPQNLSRAWLTKRSTTLEWFLPLLNFIFGRLTEGLLPWAGPCTLLNFTLGWWYIQAPPASSKIYIRMALTHR